MSESIRKIHELVTKLNVYCDEYYNKNEPSVSDAVYDRLYEELSLLEYETGCTLSNSPTQNVGYKVVSSLSKATHAIPLLSLDKTKSIEEVNSFKGTHPIMMMLKLDGLTLKLEYDKGILTRASTRGDGDTGEVVTHNIRAFRNVPLEIGSMEKLTIVGEAFIYEDDFEVLKETIIGSNGKRPTNARSLAAGSTRLMDAKVCKDRRLNFMAFNVSEGFHSDSFKTDSKKNKLEYLLDLGFQVCPFIYFEVMFNSDMELYIKTLKRQASDMHIPIDGIVITYDSISFSKSCGRTSHHYNDGIAFKFEDDLYETVLQSIEWTPSRFGELTPVAIFDTVEIEGGVSRATLSNLSIVRELELMPGCNILISKRNMIIPHVEDNLDRGKYVDTYPTLCPCCEFPIRLQSRVENDGVIETLHCDNPDCEVQWLRKLMHFSSKKAMNIEGLSEATLLAFIKQGWLTEYSDIYMLDEYNEDIMELEGFGEKSYKKLWTAIEKSCNTTFERYLIAIDIPMIGNAASKVLSKIFDADLDEFERAGTGLFDFTQIEGFGLILNENIHNWFAQKENLKLWKELQTMMTFEKTKVINLAEVVDNPFKGKVILATGKLFHFTRETINQKIISLGATVGGSVSKNTNYLICGEKAGSKLGKANDLGVTVLSEQQFLDMIG